MLLLGFCLFSQIPLRAETLKCEIEKVWTVDSARKEAFKDLKPVLDLSWAPPIDPNLIENKQAINNHQKKVDNREIILFSDGAYCVTVFDDDNYDKVYYYSSAGELIAIDFNIYPMRAKDLQDFLELWGEGKMFPFKVYKHFFPTGEILNITLTTKNNESFMFEPSGKLQYHWRADKCYNEKGNVIMTRNNSR